MSIGLFIYTHSSYTDVLNIQSDYIGKFENKNLITNQVLNNDILDVYDKIYYYDDSVPYAKRILNFISEINDEYILLVHDNDILIDVDLSMLENCVNLMRNNNYDRIDFQVGGPAFNGHTELIPIDDNNKYFLSRNDNRMCYIYNVNPSIWRVSTLKQIVQTFHSYEYINIEAPEVQNFCVDNNFKIFKLFSEETIFTPPFTVLPFFQYIHITHQGNFLPINNQLSENLKFHYSNIIEKHNLLNGPRKFDEYMKWGW